MRKFLKILTEELIYGGHWSSLAIPSVIFVSCLILRLPLTWDCLLASYLGYHTLRLYNRYKEIEADILTNPERSSHIKKYYRFLPMIVACLAFITISLFIFLGRLSGLLMAILMAIFGFLYTDFFKPRVRITGFKAFYVAFWWSLLPLFAVVYYNASISPALPLLMSFVLLRLFVNVTFFDIKDVKSDKEKGVPTLPAVFGVKKTIEVLWIISILSLLPLAVGIVLQMFSAWILTFLFLLPYTYYYLRKGLEVGEREDVFLYYILVDGEQLFLWPILALPLLLFA